MLDTNVLSELRKPRPAASVLSFVAALPLEDLFVSEVTFAEIRFGIERIGDPVRRAALHDWLAQKLRPMFEQRALPLTEDILFKWRLLVEEGRRVGHTSPSPTCSSPPPRFTTGSPSPPGTQATTSAPVCP